MISWGTWQTFLVGARLTELLARWEKYVAVNESAVIVTLCLVGINYFVFK